MDGRGALPGVVSCAGVLGAGGVTPDETFTSTLGELAGSLITFCVPPCTMALRTAAGVADGCAESSSAAAPATCGAAMEVPEMVLVAVGDVYQAEVMPEPGAKTSRHEPQLEKYERLSDDVVDPTVMAVGSDAGEYEHALSLELPAATAKVMPSATPAATAALSAAE